MIRRIFSRNTFNGYHIVSLSGGEEGGGGLLLGKPTKEKDETGSYLVDEKDIPVCPNRGKINTMAHPWSEFIIVPTLCQRCIWLYQKPDSEYDCLLITKDKRIRSGALVNGTK